MFGVHCGGVPFELPGSGYRQKKVKREKSTASIFFNIPCMLCCLYRIYESSVNKTVTGCFVA